MPRRQHGFTWLELGVVAVALGLLSLVLLHRLAYYRSLAERAMVEQTIANLRTALRIEQTVLLTQGRTYALALLAGVNPVSWLDTPPAGYRGELPGAPPGGVAPGTWYFDRGKRELAYRVVMADAFAGTPAGELRLRVAATVSAADPLPSVRIEAAAPYRWRVE